MIEGFEGLVAKGLQADAEDSEIERLSALFEKACFALKKLSGVPAGTVSEQDFARLRDIAVETAQKIARRYRRHGNAERGLKYFDELERLGITSIDVKRGAAGLAEIEGNFERAANLYLELADSGECLDALARFGVELAHANHYTLALRVLRRYDEIEKNNLEVLRALAFSALARAEYEASRAYLLRSNAINPGDKGTLLALYSTSQYLGYAAESKAYIEEAVRLFPDSADSHFSLSQVTKYEKGHWHIPLLETAYGNSAAGSRERMVTGFALFKALDAVERFDEAFDALDDANRIRRASQPYDRNIDLRQVELLLEAFSMANADRFMGGGYRDARPIFIVGMPRSGSTLTEQILASHRDTHGGGEMTLIGRMAKDNFMRKDGDLYIPELDMMTPDIFATAGQYVANEQMAVADGKPRLVDKMPFNFKWMGYVKSMLPDAKVIHVRRSPAATCLANYSSVFATETIGYLYNLEDIAAQYIMHERLMDWWKALYPGQIYDLSYEALTVNQREETRKLLDYCELDWDENCLDFYKTERTVTTSSSNQVRQAMYSGVDRKTQNYQRQLEPALKMLCDAGIDPHRTGL